MSSDAYHAWHVQHVAQGHRIEPVCALFAGGPTRWAAFADFGTPQSREVSAYVTVPNAPELEKEVPIRNKACTR